MASANIGTIRGFFARRRAMAAEPARPPFAVSAMRSLFALAAAAACAACSQQPAAPAPSESAAPAPAPVDPATVAEPPEATPAAQVLGLEGLGALRIGEPVPARSGWAEHGAQASDTCRIVTSPDYPGAYAIVEGGKVRRISLGQRSRVKLAEGIGVGASEADVRKGFGGFRESPHAYVEGGKYLTAPNAPSGDPALRFEIGADGKVSEIHVGTMPVLGYVEGCS